tara:strand:- start:858 stop:1493 length:636 start_codon:yes stop_codon:yes gene_type:complete
MKVLVFDTETTGLPKDNSNIYRTDMWPHVLQLSYLMYDTNKNKIITNQDYLIKIPKDVEISKESISVHGITRRKIQHQGYEMKYILKIFQACLENSDFVVAHNLQFDRKMLSVEGIRNKIKLDFDRSHCYCTMKSGANTCKIEKRNLHGEIYFKYPKLIELHEVLFGSEPNNLHNAYVDILVCLRCFYKIIYNDDLCIKNKNFNSLIKAYI